MNTSIICLSQVCVVQAPTVHVVPVSIIRTHRTAPLLSTLTRFNCMETYCLSNCTFLFHCFKFIARIRIRIKKISAKQQICLSKSRCTCTLYDITHSIHVYLFNQVGGPYRENIISA